MMDKLIALEGIQNEEKQKNLEEESKEKVRKLKQRKK